jgi:hypothetical protein
MTFSARLAVTALALASLAGTTLAQSQPKKTEEPALKGPAVKEAGVPGENRQFGDGKVKGKERMGTEIPHRLFMKALDVLRGDSADAATRLSDEQDSKIKAINDGFMASVAKYRADHQTEAMDLIKQLPPDEQRKAREFLGREARGLDVKGPKLGEKGKKGKAPGPEAATDDMTGQTDAKKAEDAKAKLRELLEAAPKPADTHTQIFAVLADPQKAAFQKEMDRLRKDMQDRAGEKRLDRKAAQKDPAAGKDIDINDPRIPEQMRERLKNMSPEDRQQALSRLGERLKRGRVPGDAKPAPATDTDVNVPKPDPK